MRGGFRYRRRKACGWHHPRTTDGLAPCVLPPQQCHLDMARFLILMLVTLTDRHPPAPFLLQPQPRLTADPADVLASRPMFLQSAVDRTGARVGLDFAFVGALCPYADPRAVLFAR
jgi:hypothetical protein